MKKALVCLGSLALAFAIAACDTPSSSQVYSVTLQLEGGNIGGNEGPVVMEVKGGRTVPDLPSPEKEGYTFEGWFQDIAGTGEPFTESTAVGWDRVLYAKWERAEYTVTLDYDYLYYNGIGDWVPMPVGIIPVKPGGLITAYPIVYRPGYEAIGWFTEKNGAGEEFLFNETKVYSDLTLYAKWVTGTNSLTIRSVTPSDNLTPRVMQQFTIVIDYELVFDNGIITLDINDGDRMSETREIASDTINKGSGSKTYVITAFTRDWERDHVPTIAGEVLMFRIYARLTYGHQGLIFKHDTKKLTFKDY